MDLHSRRSLATGGTTRIGRAIRKTLINNGATVAAGYRSSASAAAELVARIHNAPVSAIAANLTELRWIEHLCG